MRSRQLKVVYWLVVSMACAPVLHKVFTDSDVRHGGDPAAARAPHETDPPRTATPSRAIKAAPSHAPATRTSTRTSPAPGRTANRSDKPAPDHSGHARTGHASFYADRFGGRKMADGTPMDLRGDNAASRTLPLGTRALVTNLETNKQAVITIQDRGPYVDGRIVDLSPATAATIGLTRTQGITLVEVAPITVPLPDGRVVTGEGASISTLN